MKFIARKQWFVAGSDDMQIYVYNYNTQEKIKVQAIAGLVGARIGEQDWGDSCECGRLDLRVL